MITEVDLSEMTYDDVVPYFTHWADETTFFPFAMSDGGQVVGPGHMDKDTFALLIPQLTGEDVNVEDVNHRFVKIYRDDEGNISFEPVVWDMPNSFPVTTWW